MASELGIAILSALGGGLQGYVSEKKRGQERATDLLLETERILEARKARREQIQATKEEGAATRTTQENIAGKQIAGQKDITQMEIGAKQAEGAANRTFEGEQGSLQRALQLALENLRSSTSLGVAKIGAGDFGSSLDVNAKVDMQVEQVFKEVLKSTGNAEMASQQAAQAKVFWEDFYRRSGAFAPTPPEAGAESGISSGGEFAPRGLGLYGLPVDLMRLMGRLQPPNLSPFLDPTYEPFRYTAGARRKKLKGFPTHETRTLK